MTDPLNRVAQPRVTDSTALFMARGTGADAEVFLSDGALRGMWLPLLSCGDDESFEEAFGRYYIEIDGSDDPTLTPIGTLLLSTNRLQATTIIYSLQPEDVLTKGRGRWYTLNQLEKEQTVYDPLIQTLLKNYAIGVTTSNQVIRELHGDFRLLTSNDWELLEKVGVDEPTLRTLFDCYAEIVFPLPGFTRPMAEAFGIKLMEPKIWSLFSKSNSISFYKFTIILCILDKSKPETRVSRRRRLPYIMALYGDEGVLTPAAQQNLIEQMYPGPSDVSTLLKKVEKDRFMCYFGTRDLQAGLLEEQMAGALSEAIFGVGFDNLVKNDNNWSFAAWAKRRTPDTPQDDDWYVFGHRDDGYQLHKHLLQIAPYAKVASFKVKPDVDLPEAEVKVIGLEEGNNEIRWHLVSKMFNKKEAEQGNICGRIKTFEFDHPLSIYNPELPANTVLADMKRYLKMEEERDKRGRRLRYFKWNGTQQQQINFMADARRVICQASDVCRGEDRLIRLEAPVHVFGDIHGNLWDLLCYERIFWPMGPHLAGGSFLFLGDYVDRGRNSLYVLVYLSAMKILNPTKFFILRGNHEDISLNVEPRPYHSVETELTHLFRDLLNYPPNKQTEEQHKTVKEEVGSLMTIFAKLYSTLPVAAVIQNQVFCCHGGIPEPHLMPRGLQSINDVGPTLVDPRTEQLVHQLLWNDPVRVAPREGINESMTSVKTTSGGDDLPDFAHNSMRNTGKVFTKQALDSFLERFGFKYMLRAHEVAEAGFQLRHGMKLFMVFSSSNYPGIALSNQSATALVTKKRLRLIKINTIPEATQGRKKLPRKKPVAEEGGEGDSAAAEAAGNEVVESDCLFGYSTGC